MAASSVNASGAGEAPATWTDPCASALPASPWTTRLEASPWTSLRDSLWTNLDTSLRDSLFCFLGVTLIGDTETIQRLTPLIQLLPHAIPLGEKKEEPGTWLVLVA